MIEKEFDETMLPGLLAHEIEAAHRVDGSDEAKRRAENIEYLRGEMNDVAPRPNGSSVTSRDVNDTIAWMLPGIMRVFTASDRMAVYEPAEPGDDQYAEQATDYANHIFWKDNDGYRNLYDATYDALGVSGDAIVKHWWDETPETEILWFTGLSAEQIAALEEDEEVEVLTQRAGEAQTVETTDEMGQPTTIDIETFDVKVERVCRYGTLRIKTIEPENFLINEEAIDIEDYRFCAHKDPYMTKSGLIEMGFDRDKVDMLSTDRTFDDTEEALSRNETWSGLSYAQQESMQRVDLYECYVRIDVDGDGIAETIRVYYAGRGASGGVVLEWEVWEDEVPFSKIPCYPRAHQFVSENVADRTKDVQRLRTVFWRAINDNTIASGLPQREVEEGSVLNPDVLVSPKFGSLIWKKRGSAPIIPHEIPFAADKMFPVMELLDGIIEKRTGVSRTMMALDPEALQGQTATASQNARDASYSQTELIARNMAEGWRKVFSAILRLLTKHQDRPRVIRLRNDYVEIDPRVWNANMDCSINIGLGSGSRDRDMAMLNVILGAQRELTMQLAGGGFSTEAVAMIPKITETLHDLAESAGIKSPERYFPEFPEDKIKAMIEQASKPRPDPALALEQAKGEVAKELKQVDAQVTMREAEIKAQGDIVKNQAELEADMATREAERQNAMMIKAQEIQWEREKFSEEMRFKYAELEQRTLMERERNEAAERQAREAARQKAQQNKGKAA